MSKADDLVNELRSEYQIEDRAGIALLEIIRDCYARILEYQDAIARDGVQVLDRFGQAKAHPLLAEEVKARTGMMHALKALNVDLEPLNDGPGRPAGKAY